MSSLASATTIKELPQKVYLAPSRKGDPSCREDIVFDLKGLVYESGRARAKGMPIDMNGCDVGKIASCMEGGTDKLFNEQYRFQKINFRIMWPGYLSSEQGISINVDAMTTRAALARKVAWHIANFVHNVANPTTTGRYPYTPQSLDYRIPPYIDMDTIYLKSLKNTCAINWQATIIIAPKSNRSQILPPSIKSET